MVVPHEGRWNSGVQADHGAGQLHSRQLVGHRRVLHLERLDHLVAHGQDAAGLLRPGFGLLAEDELAVEHPHRPVADAGALLAPVAGEGQEQAHRPLHQVAVVVLAGVPAGEQVGLLARGLAGQGADDLRVGAADRRGLLRGVVLQRLAEEGEYGGYLNGGAVLELGLERPLQGRVQLAQGKGAARCLLQLLAPAVVEVELILTAPVLDVPGAQESAVVQAHQQRQVRLLLDEGRVVQPFVDDRLAHGQSQGGVGARPHRHVAVGVHR